MTGKEKSEMYTNQILTNTMNRDGRMMCMCGYICLICMRRRL